MINALIALVAFLGVLAVLIITHELGHFLTAKGSGIKVEEFGVGFPPRLFAIKRGETEYSLNAVPLGGFTKMAGEEDPRAPRGLASKRLPTRLLVLSAGSLMNAILPILLFSVAFMLPHDVVAGEVTVEKVVADSPAAKAGINPGDVIVSLNGRPVRNISDLQRYMSLNLGEKVTLIIKRSDSTSQPVQIIPRWKPPEGQGATGIVVKMLNPSVVSQSYPFWEAVPLGVTENIETFILFKNEIEKWLIGAASPQIAGPVGIAQLTGEVARAGISPLLEFAAFLSINLAILNIFPLPALDGGRIVFVLLEGIRRGRRVSPKTEGLVHLVGFALLMAVMVVISYYDIARIMSGATLIP